MAKFLLLWKFELTRLPVDFKEQIAGRTKLLNMVKDDLERGGLKDWGSFPGELAGYGIVEGTEQEVIIWTAKYTPYVRFETHPVASVSQALESMKALSQR